MRYPFVILDLNGTLVDTFDDLTAALNDVLAGQGRAPLDTALVRQWSGEGLRALLRMAFRATGPTLTDPEISEILNVFREVYADHLGARACLYPGVATTLATLAGHGVRMSILTNKPQAPSLKLLDRLGIGHFFDYMVAGDGASARKPDPAGLLQLTALLGGGRDDTLMVGSSRIDLETARNAGVRCALVEHGSGLQVRGLGADYVLDPFDRLVALAIGPRQAQSPSARP